MTPCTVRATRFDETIDDEGSRATKVSYVNRRRRMADVWGKLVMSIDEDEGDQPNPTISKLA